MDKHQDISNLFRTEYSKLIAVLCKSYGLDQIEVAEDIVSETFLLATETWGLKGFPNSPVGWLYAVAKNKTKDFLKRKKIFREKVAPSLNDQIERQQESINLSQRNIQDSQLQMLFAICHSSLSNESQISLALKILCGLSVDQIAAGFLTKKATINKRLYRAKETLRMNNVKVEFPNADSISSRLSNVMTTIYLLFNEGYYSSSENKLLNKDFCLEALRLAVLLTKQSSTHTPEVDAFIALMCFHTSRFEARFHNDKLLLYNSQDKDLWDTELIEKGEYYLNLSSKGEDITKYHLEAAIAFWHTQDESDEKWENILQLYNYLLQIEYSPVAALNRTYALSKVKSIADAIKEAKKIGLKHSHLYHMLLANFYESTDKKSTLKHLDIALELTSIEKEKEFIIERILIFSK